MLITKKKHDEIVAALKAELETQKEWTQEMKRQRDCAMQLGEVLQKLTGKVELSCKAFSGIHISGGSLACEAINGIQIGENLAQYVDDFFGGKVIKQEATKVIQISKDGEVSTGLTRQKPDDGFTYILRRQ